MTRTHLANRRSHESIAFEFRGLAYIAGVGRSSDGSPAEIFLHCSKASSPVADEASDVAVCLSIALQHRVPAEAIRSAVTREANGKPSGIAGARRAADRGTQPMKNILFAAMLLACAVRRQEPK